MIKRQASTGPVISASFHHNIVAQGNLLETLGKKNRWKRRPEGEGFQFERIAASGLPSAEEEERCWQIPGVSRGLLGNLWRHRGLLFEQVGGH